MKIFALAAGVCFSLFATNDAASQTKPDVLQLKPVQMGKLVDFDVFTGRRVLGLRFEFEGGTIRGIWGTDGVAVVSFDPIEGESRWANLLWTPRAGSLVGFSWGGTQPGTFFGVGHWRKNTQPPSPAILIGLLFDPGITSISAAPLTLQYDRTGRMTITLDAFSAHRLRVFER